MLEIVFYIFICTFHFSRERLTQMMKSLLDSCQTMKLGVDIRQTRIKLSQNLSESFLNDSKRTSSRYFSLSNFLAKISLAILLNIYLAPSDYYSIKSGSRLHIATLLLHLTLVWFMQLLDYYAFYTFKATSKCFIRII